MLMTPKTVYLDQNHWVSLAQASTGHKKGQEYREALDQCREAVNSGRARFVLSATRYEEMYVNRNYRQRQDVARVMEELTGFWVLAPIGEILAEECDRALQKRFDRPFTIREVVSKFGIGVQFAFTGRQLKGTIQGPVKELTSFRGNLGPGGHEAPEAEFTRLAEQMLLRGPSDQEVSEMPDYRPEMAASVTEDRRARLERFAQALGSEALRGERALDFVCAEELVAELHDQLGTALWRAGIPWKRFFSLQKEGMTAFLFDMPSRAVAITLKVENLKQRDRHWTVQDIRDVDGLSEAVPYCDIVVTEAHACELLQRSRLPERFNCVVIRRLEDLPGLLTG
jgi:hypothetical protein